MTSLRRATDPGYPALLKDLSGVLESARRASARAVNTLMTATYWEIGRRVVEYEQRGAQRAEYGAELLAKLSADLTLHFGRGFSPDNLEAMRRFYRAFPGARISETLPRKSRSPNSETPSRISVLDRVGNPRSLVCSSSGHRTPTANLPPATHFCRRT